MENCSQSICIETLFVSHSVLTESNGILPFMHRVLLITSILWVISITFFIFKCACAVSGKEIRVMQRLSKPVWNNEKVLKRRRIVECSLADSIIMSAHPAWAHVMFRIQSRKLHWMYTICSAPTYHVRRLFRFNHISTVSTWYIYISVGYNTLQCLIP